eukprot:scaffold96075_cov31-Tisochrysis_lutea.AAC.1
MSGLRRRQWLRRAFRLHAICAPESVPPFAEPHATGPSRPQAARLAQQAFRSAHHRSGLTSHILKQRRWKTSVVAHTTARIFPALC